MAQEDKVDRGDDFVPTPDEEEKKVDVALKEGEKGEKDEVAEGAEEEKPEKEAETEKEPAEKENFIPHSRFKEAVEKERSRTEAANARAKELEGQLSAQATSEDLVAAQAQIKEMVKKRNQHLSDGELDKAGEVDEHIFNLQEAIADRKAEYKAYYAKEQAKEEMKYDTVVAKLEVDHGELDPESDEYDQDTVDEIRALTRGYQVEMKMTPAAALSRAAKRVFGTPAKAAAIKEEDSKAKKAAAERKTEAVGKNLEAAKKQPASSKDVGLDHDKRGGGLDAKTVMRMNYKEFSELSEDVLSKMRGDTL